MGKRSRRRGAEAPAASQSVVVSGAHTFGLRGAMSAATRSEYAALAGSAVREDAWHRQVEFLFERLVVSWSVEGLEPLTRQKDLLARFRFASEEERRLIRDVLRDHLAEHFPDVEAP